MMHVVEEKEKPPQALGLVMLDVEVEDGSIRELATSKDGFKLFPQPIIGDELDPLNWSFVQKHTILSTIMAL